MLQRTCFEFHSPLGQSRPVRAGEGASALPEGSRVILPGDAVTQDFVDTRLNVVIDGNASVERLYCG